MKLLSSVTVMALMIFVFSSCQQQSVKDNLEKKKFGDTYKDKADSRIEVVETTVQYGYRFSIIRVDGKEFIVNSRGGILPLSDDGRDVLIKRLLDELNK